MKINVIGVGYIGLPTSAILANSGHHVVGVDINSNYIQELNNRLFKTNEKDLLNLINSALDNGKLIFKTIPEESDVFIICVPTPLKKEKTPDLTHIYNAIDSILGLIRKNNLIVIESTIPPGTIKNLIIPLIEKSGLVVGSDIFLSYCPERVLPNNIIYELINNPRIIGGYSIRCSSKTKELYRTFVKGEIFTEDIENVEMVKLVENAYRDVNIAFANELGLLCDSMGLMPYKIIEMANMHPRVNILKPGIGVGGHCIPVDSYFLMNDNFENTNLIKMARNINENMPSFVANKVIKLSKHLSSPKVALWGISYKADSSDIRNSPALEILKILEKNNISVIVYDPVVYNHPMEFGIKTLKDADILLLLVNHSDFHKFDFSKYIHNMKEPMILDCIEIIKGDIGDNVKLYNLFDEVNYG